MRVEHLSGVTRREAVKACPWACKICKVEGGWIAFESTNDYLIWRNQR
jgi:hypothetical protein